MREKIAIDLKAVASLDLVHKYLLGVPIAALHIEYCKVTDKCSYPVFARELKDISEKASHGSNS